MKFDGAKLKAIRSEHGLTMVDLVAKLGMSNQSYISQIEKGARNPRPNISKRIAEVFGVPESYFYLEETPVNADNHRQACTVTRIKKEEIEQVIIDLIQDEFLAPDNLQDLTKTINDKIKELYSGYVEEFNALKSEKEGIQRKINNLLDVIESGGATDIIKARLNDNSHRLKAIEERLMTLTRQAPADYLNENQIAEILQKFAEKEKSPDTSRAMIDTFLDNVIVSNSEIIITLHFDYRWWRRTESSGIKNIILFEYTKKRRH